MILNKYRNTCPRPARTSVGFISAAALLATTLGIALVPQVALAQTIKANVEFDETQPAKPGPSIKFQQPAVEPIVSVDVTPQIAVPTAPLLAAAPELPAEPTPATPRRKARAATESDEVERRIDRLERMVEELVARDKAQLKGEITTRRKITPPNVNGNLDGRELARVQRDLDRAAKEVERAAKQSHQWQHEWSIDGKTSFSGDPKSLKAHRKALEGQRKALEKQLAAVEKQLDELEKQEEDAEDRAENAKNQPNPPAAKLR